MSTNNGSAAPWTVERSAELYQIRGWGQPYFGINAEGHVEVRPDPQSPRTIDLHLLVNDLEARGLALPLLIRFSDILDDRIRTLNEAFQRAMAEAGYTGGYQGVYPVKVNQQRHLVEEVVRYGKRWKYGLEAGSKPELLIALAMMEENEGLIICNGYKDLLYIETALVAQRFDKTVFIVLERIEELDLVFRASERVGIAPKLGVRVKLSTKGIGRWADSVGERAKFGLTAAEIVDVVDRLAARDMLECLQLLHFHMGSQVSSIIPVKNALREASQYYVELARMGAPMRYFDVGGGLAVDYDGSRTDFHASMNYGVQEYASDVVYAVQEACERARVPVPTIVTESGRAVAAYQSVLVVEVLGSNASRLPEPSPPPPGAHPVLATLYDTWRGVQPKNVQEAWHDVSQAREEAQSLFRFGYLGLRERGAAEQLVMTCGRKILETARRMKQLPEDLQALERYLSLIYYCNFSVFQSAPDTWAIDQLFPIMPIHRLDEEPTVRATLADLTCDSDGVIDHFIDAHEVAHVLPVHELREGEPYRLGMFLTGAYQEILGDLHNLFGDTNAVHVRLSESGYDVVHVIKGDEMHEVLRYVQYDPEAMVERVRRQAERALSAGRITPQQMKRLMRHYEQSLRSYTYLTDEE
ncbi:MAG: biosynthetic arginine decarboxylase [Myxococcales bacterium]|nr:biosynthetic arginine decarboxylase [Myxococcales bacterium]